jgi:Arc/MetJ-type ribon-helix-helix transcriptional regulator
MTDKEMVVLTIEVTAEQREQINQRAQERGYESPSEYLLALINEDVEEENEEDVDPVELFREGWQDMLNGNTYPASTLWEDIDDE